jgi:hypothetical protein
VNHSDIESMMADYLEGDLALEKRALFDAHLDSCDDCTLELSEMRSTIAVLRAMPAPEAPGDLADNVMRRVRNGEGRSEWWDRLVVWFNDLLVPRLAVPATAAATALAILLVTGQIQIPPQGDVGGGTVVAQAHPEITITFEGIDPSRVADPVKGFAGPGRIHFGSTAMRGGPWNTRGASSRDLRVQSAPRNSVLGMELGNAGTVRLVSAADPELYGTHSDQGRRLRGRSSRTLGWDRALAPAIPSMSSPDEVELRSQHALDERLNRLKRAPAQFARRQAQLSLAEQELWSRRLAERAAELGRLDDYAALLRSTGDPAADQLANGLESWNSQSGSTQTSGPSEGMATSSGQ